MSEEHLARDFLNAIGDLEREMVRLGARDPQGLGDAVRQLTDSRSLVRRYRSDLLTFATLRNAIAHNSYMHGRPIATPLPETVSRAKEVLAQFTRPAQAFDFGHTPLMFDESADLQPALQEMASRRLSQAPVTSGGVYKCMLTTNAVARWLASNIDQDGNVLMTEVRVADVVKHLEDHEVAKFAARSLTASEAVDLLTRKAPPLAVLLTQDGNKAQSILKILVASDVPAMMMALGA